ncbi:Stress responsive A/B Barrel Domain [Clostridium cavendishii DSM 21758]|uniref:Stress responsive A/B Barrel Domain n=1 Tax=Clostridium cavendishii DSM 21758 TaxID=1121302 RepID=A0A1M6TWR6_9CLOT|nr:Dabb family protein [Clostridium cavendishii]SHK61485.1 Stress responsive A/B Barrel Domain [Clostridium cavendishii DSM 21758]
MFTHIVFFKLKEATQDNVDKVKNILLSMNGKIIELKGLEVGVDVIRSDRSYDIALVTKFESKEDYDVYAICDYHLNEVIAKIKPLIQCSKTVDYIG